MHCRCYSVGRMIIFSGQAEEDDDAARDDWTVMGYRRGDFLASSLFDPEASSVAVILDCFCANES